MNLLAIDTSTETASVALLIGNEFLCAEQSNQKTHAQFILPMIDKLMINASLSMNQLDGIVFGCGPGSFTGLRIACSIAKGLAYAHDLPLFSVSSLVAIAWLVRQQKQSTLPVLAVLDARMHEVYWSYFDQDEWRTDEQVNPVNQLSLPEKQAVILAGVGIDLYWDNFTQEVKSQISEQFIVKPTAKAMIEFVLFSGVDSVAATQAQPVYVRNKVT